MTDKPSAGPRPRAAKERQERLARALRTNLKRRKSQARGRAEAGREAAPRKPSSK